VRTHVKQYFSVYNAFLGVTGLYVKGIYRLLENTGAYSVRTCVGLTILRRGI
jgi:hypothetical protein